MSLSITANFDAGAVDVLSCEHAGDIRLRVRRDSHADFAQWFYFRLSGARGARCVMTFENASECAFAEGWRERCRRPMPDGKLMSSTIDDAFIVAQEKVISHWLKELSTSVDF